MPIDIAAVRGAELPVRHGRWDEDAVILYHLVLEAECAERSTPVLSDASIQLR